MRLFEDHRRILIYSLIVYLICNLLDLATSEACRLWVPGCVELNQFMRDPITHKFILVQALIVKAFLTVGFLIPVSFILGRAFRSWAVASLPWWYLGLAALAVSVNNILLILW